MCVVICMSENSLKDNGLERVKSIVCEILSSVDAEYVGKMDFQKIIYLLQKKMDEEVCPFYWYKHGPYSETIAHAVEELEQDEVISPHEKGGYATEDVVKKEMDKRTKETLYLIIDQYSFRRDRESFLEEDIYPDAPFEFQRYFRNECYPEFKKFRENHRSYSARTASKFFRDRLNRAEAFLPLDSRFDEFNEEFSRFAFNIRTYFESVDSDDFDTKDLDVIMEIAKKIWSAFVEFVRLETAENFPKERMRAWEQKAEEKLEFVKRFNDVLEKRAVDMYERSGKEWNRADEKSVWGQLVKSLIKSSGGIDLDAKNGQKKQC